MTTLFKTRSFGELLNDSFAFFKRNGRHYFKNYFVINGSLLLVLLVLLYFIIKVFFEVLFSGVSAPSQSGNFMAQYFQDNTPMIIAAITLTGLLTILITMLHYAFPVVYLQLYEENGGPNFSTRDMIQRLRSKLGKIFLFFLASIVVFLPLLLIVGGLSFLLVFIIIGIPLLFIVGPAFISWVSFSFYDYLDDDKNFLTAVGNAFDLIKSKFWTVVGSTLLMYFIIQIALTIVTMIPYAIGLFTVFTNTANGMAQKEVMQIFSVLMAVVLELSVALNYILGNFLLVNQGLAYYSCREAEENHTSLSQIDSIGNSFE